MKIGLDAKRALHNHRGLGNFSRTLLLGLEKYIPAHEFHLYSPLVKSKLFEDWKAQHPSFNYHFPSNKLLQLIPSVWRSLLLTSDLEKEELDIYHGLSHELPPGIEKTNIKSVVTIHDLIYLRFPQYFSSIDRNIYNVKFRKSCKKADKIIAICNQTKDDIVNYFNINPDKIEVHYQACHPQFYDLCSDSDKKEHRENHKIRRPYMLYIGALEERKNSLGLLKAYASIADIVDHDLIIIGRGGNYKDNLLTLIESYGIKDRVRILSDIPYDENPLFCQNADLMVFPSFFEGFGLPIVEAMFSGTPVITSEGGVFPEAGGNAACYVDPNNPASIADAITLILGSKNLQEEMVEKGFEKVKDFHLEKTSKKLMTFYESL
ncbi:MAG: glycosyltransferase family 4 protein [Bacteriovoracaceae bacterium]|jgi:glycosyltransferase involved in cell wall biosynthesis|nr:glycosyltransferase family 4 protein [Bacteriovoracaceae bacterium]